ncbi:class I SAM-dependent methyltransferase [Roseibium sp.]|uniref:class I SAM-dependent methyltransferase n=1 Tax=Roseibium sp. TaxID=1936156 RepID=UPI003A974477
MTSADTRQSEWDDAYQRGDNFLFYPNEEVIRFFARKVAKRTGINEIRYHSGFGTQTRVLDFGCGIGRHVKFAKELGLDACGIDLSVHAISTGREWLSGCGFEAAEDLLVQGEGGALPFDDGSFDIAVSHGVLDSMPFAIALECMAEISRVLKPGSLFYLDLISNDDTDVEPGFSSEVVVEKQHEIGTIQSYFDEAKIDRLLGNSFDLIEKVHVQRRDITANTRGGRYHLIASRI